MSKMITRFDRKPPLPKSPVRRFRPGGALRSVQNTAQSPPAASIKTSLATRSSNLEKLKLQLENNTISSEFQVCVSNPLFKRGRFYDEYSARRNERLKRKRDRAHEEEVTTDDDLGFKSESPKKAESKRGEVTVIRKDKEKENKAVNNFGFGVSKMHQVENKAFNSTPIAENNVANDFGYRVESAKKTESKRRQVAKRREVVPSPMTEKKPRENSRYMLRSMNKENKKSPLPVKYESSEVGNLVTRTRA